MAAPKHWMLDKLTGVFVSAGRERAWGWDGLVPGGFPGSLGVPGSGAALGLPVGRAGEKGLCEQLPCFPVRSGVVGCSLLAFWLCFPFAGLGPWVVVLCWGQRSVKTWGAGHCEHQEHIPAAWLAVWLHACCLAFCSLGPGDAAVLEQPAERFCLQAPRPSTGPHKLRECLPLIIFLRNRLKYALTGDEVKKICMQRFIKIDGKVRTDITYPAGFMGEREGWAGSSGRSAALRGRMFCEAAIIWGKDALLVELKYEQLLLSLRSAMNTGARYL